MYKYQYYRIELFFFFSYLLDCLKIEKKLSYWTLQVRIWHTVFLSINPNDNSFSLSK